MTILVLSDSHSGLSFMRYCIQKVKPEHIIHLGDYFDDATAMAQEHPHIRFHQLPGNGDPWAARTEPGIKCYDIGGVRLFMTHGHYHGVKGSLDRLMEAARENGAAVALFGHTHEPICFEVAGLLVMNPGTCRSWSGSVGVLQIQDGKITDSKILWQADLELCDRENK